MSTCVQSLGGRRPSGPGMERHYGSVLVGVRHRTFRTIRLATGRPQRCHDDLDRSPRVRIPRPGAARASASTSALRRRAARDGLAGLDAARLRRARPRGAASSSCAAAAFTFPGMKIAEIFGIDDGPLYEEIRRNILHINGADHSRLRGLVNPAFTPRAVERWRPFMRGDPRRAVRRARAARAATPSRRSASPIRVAGDRDADGRAARGRRAAVGLVEPDPAPVRDDRGRGARRRSSRR